MCDSAGDSVAESIAEHRQKRIEAASALLIAIADDSGDCKRTERSR